MDTPNPPQDLKLRNIIDKLAQFVARNGTDFEQMTMNKQNGNPNFAFLFGGEHYNYYRHKVAAEQAATNFPLPAVPGTMAWHHEGSGDPGPPVLKQKSHLSTPPPAAAMAGSQQQQPVVWSDPAVADQVRQSEQNLMAQHQVLMQQQQVQVDDAIRKAQEDQLYKLAAEVEIDLAEFDKLLLPITESCTKDAISAGKGWIFSHSTSPQHNEVIAKYLLKRISTPGASFEYKLHLVYLINDLLHHCVRKSAEGLKKSLEQVVVPIFCTTSIGIDDDKQQKLSKLLKLWENNNYFTPKVLEQLKNPAASLGEYQAGLITEHAIIITPITQAIQTHYLMLQKQHQDFVTHYQQQQQQMGPPPPFHPHSLPPDQEPPDHLNGGYPPVNFHQSQPPPGFMMEDYPPPPQQQQQQFPPAAAAAAGPPYIPPPPPPPPPLPSNSHPDLMNPDMSKPPPGYIPEGPPEALIPNVPYYDLPAGLMVPLVRLEDYQYKPLNPKLMRLPPPVPPTERLLQAVEMFYAPPSHDHPRNSDGWEQLGLYEFFKAKTQAKRQVQLLQQQNQEQVAPSPEQVEDKQQLPLSKQPSPPRRRRYKENLSPPPPSGPLEDR